MKKIFSVIIVGCIAVMLNAGPHHHGPPPRPNNGIRLATDIIGLVGLGLDVLRPPVYCTPGYCAPAVVPAPPAYAVPQVIPPRPIYPYATPNIVVAPVTNVYPAPAVAPPVVYTPPVAPAPAVVYPQPGYVYPGYYR